MSFYTSSNFTPQESPISVKECPLLPSSSLLITGQSTVGVLFSSRLTRFMRHREPPGRIRYAAASRRELRQACTSLEPPLRARPHHPCGYSAADTPEQRTKSVSRRPMRGKEARGGGGVNCTLRLPHTRSAGPGDSWTPQ